ncbi:COP9 signalosome complex subunit 8 [Ctenocephalides felis]|uniref:COP9 signalosome complex subunit 8 n=1 Tax=Ctenocephalides felis TaxID=7515 RepID=UPI000E6E2B81|nr:COP9 signalosome complex subunit 8 [Ctenocephalides felis]
MDERMNKLVSELEKQELELATSNTSPTAGVYSQLLALYLYQNDLCNAKFLWQRIPEQIKNDNPELALIWAVGKCMWKRDYPSTYKALKNNWSDSVCEIMKNVEEKLRSRAVTLITQAYSSVSIDTVSEMTGLAEDMVIAACKKKGWAIEEATRSVIPTRAKLDITSGTTSEDQLHKLTEYVSFLEN